MTKLMEWLAVLTLLGGVWYGFLTQKIPNNFDGNLVLFSPIIVGFLFAFYAATVVLYRTFTFNDCNDAAVELHKEIEEAKEDLKKLGFNFKN